ncbi:MAG: hypothetical protein ABW140_10030 [Candidatus Sedimenticola sp. 6PFRAG1]
MRRREFLKEFLGALGAEEIEWINETPEKISGKVIYEINDPEEIQEFIWRKHESDVPDQKVIALIKLIRKDNLLSIDQLRVTREELRRIFNAEYGLSSTEQEFSSVLEALEEVEVSMVDEGKETDAYFIHE